MYQNHPNTEVTCQKCYYVIIKGDYMVYMYITTN